MTSAGRSQGRAFAVLVLAVGAFTLLQSLVIPVVATIQREFGTSQSTAVWVVTAYLLASAVSAPFLGRLGDLYGKQRMLVACLLALSIGSVVATMAPDIGWMIAARALQGGGGGAVMPLAFGILRDIAQPRRLAAQVGVLASTSAAMLGVGILAAGPILKYLGFAWLFVIPAVVTAVAAAGAVAWVPRSPAGGATRISVVPALLLPIWMTALLLAIAEVRHWGWTSAMTMLCVAAVLTLAPMWVRAERRAEVPLVDLSMMRIRGVWTSHVAAIVLGFGVFSSLTFVPQFVQTPAFTGYGPGATVIQAGWILVPWSVMAFLVGFVAPRLAVRFGARWVIVIGMLCNMAANAVLAALPRSLSTAALCMVLQGIASGLVVSPVAGMILVSVRTDQTGAASGMNANIRMIGGSLGASVTAAVVTAHVGLTGYPSASGYRWGFTVLAAVAALGAAVSMLMPRTSLNRPPANRSAGPVRPGDPAELAESNQGTTEPPSTTRSLPVT